MEQWKIVEIINTIPIFSDLPKEQLTLLYKQFEKKTFISESLIFSENEKGQDLFIILSGAVEVFNEYNGKRKVLAVLKEGDFFGEISVLTSLPRTASIKAVTDVEMLVLYKQNLLDLIKMNYIFSLNIIKALSEKLINANQQINWLTFKNVQGRIAAQLFLLSNKFGKKVDEGILITLKTPHKFIADLAGLPRETVSRAMNQFKEENSIIVKDKNIIISDVEKLLAWA